MTKYEESVIIIPQKYSFYNVKRIVTNTTLKDSTNKNTERRATTEIAEQAHVDLLQFHKIKDAAMINVLIEFVPEGTAKDMLIEALSTGNKKNIVFDTTKEQVPFTKLFAEQYEVSQRSVQEGISRLVKLDLVVKLNKYQYMLNPYFIAHNNISISRVAEIQHHWDLMQDPTNNIRTEVVWIKSEKIGNSYETEKDLTAMLDSVKQADADHNELKKIKKQHLKEDIETLQDLDTLAAYRKLLVDFVIKNNYVEDIEKEDKLPTKIIQHFAKYIRKGQEECWDAFITLPTLHLDGTYKPIRLLDKED